MSKKGIIIICLIMCVILSLQAVSAAEVDQDNNDVLKIQNVTDVPTYSLPNSQEMLKAGNGQPGTFSDLQANITGATVTLENNFTWDSSTDSGITTGITISQDTYITGYGVIIDAQQKTRVFDIINGAHVTLEGITFINGKATGNGGSVLSNGQLTIYNCTFIDNSATGNGGAVSMGDNSVISNSKFIRNTAVGTKDNGGGAVFGGNGVTIKDNSIFINNTCTGAGDGGAITVIDNARISNVTIINSSSGARAGALRIGTYGIVSDCFIDNCVATTYGGAISAGINCEFYNSRFTRNKFAENSPTDMATGGVVNVRSDGPIKIVSNCTFIGNTAREGGALYTKDKIGLIIDSIFINNTATDKTGGAVFSATKANTNITVINSNFTGNKAKTGGAIHAGDLSVYDSNFISNIALTGVGGAISIDASSKKLSLNNTNFTGNTAKNDGGAVRSYATDITDSNFIGNGANNTGGATKFDGATTINNTLFKDNYQLSTNGNYGGGAIFISAGNFIRIYNSDFIGNDALSSGAAIRSSVATTIDNVNFTNNRARGGASDGGAIHISATNSKVSYAIFNGNNATRNGGAIYWTGTSGVIEYSNFTNNNASGLGGAVYWNGDSGSISNSNFTKSRSSSGGAIYVPAATTNIFDSTFTDNIAFGSAANGGAINSLGNNNRIENSVFNNNVATGNGGGIYARGINTRIIGNFTGNNATNGCAIYTGSGDSNVERENPIYMTDSNFVSNHASNEGGAIFSGYICGQIYTSTFINNSAALGGAVSMVCENELVRDCYFENNTATDKGGSIYLQRISDSEIRNSIFINSRALNGGAIYNKGGGGASVYINNNTFINNIAVYNGGAIYYVVDAGKIIDGELVTKTYRDYNNFDGEGTIEDGRTTVELKNTRGTSYGSRIFHSLFEGNEDYFINMTVESYGNVAVVSLTDPKGIDKSSLVIKIDIIEDDVVVDTFTIDSSNYDAGHWNEEQEIFYNTFELEREHNYTAVVSFYDNNYLMKEINASFNTSSQTEGDFQILQDLIDEALERGEDSIILTRPYTYNALDIMNHTGCINITKPFTIYGGGWSINAAGYCRIFDISSANVNLVNLDLVGGNALGRDGDGIEKGGAIYWTGSDGNLINCTISDSIATVGGGIYFDETASDCIIVDSEFIRNNATGNGGAIDCNAPRMRLTNTLFDRNYGEYGAALCREEHATEGSGSNNTFIGNVAKKGGAALGWIKAQEITIINYTFINNTAGESGGAIFVDEYSTSCTVINCTFEGNHITNETFGHGGAIEWYADKGVVINSTFTNNYAYDGGAIYANNESEEIIIDNSIFDGNYAFSSGGAISLEASKVSINDTAFRNNHAVTSGGAVYVSGAASSNDVSYSVFENNWVTNGNGGAIDWLASAGLVLYSNFTNNSAIYGGAIYLNGISDNTNISNSIFIGNNATQNGGAIDWNATNGGLFNNQFISNEANYGAALCREIGARGGNGTNNTFTANHARISGAALGWMGSDNIKIVNYNFTNNTADVSGAAIYVSNTSNNCSVIDCNFIGNHVLSHNPEAYGGAIDWRGADGKIRNSNFTENHAYNGGAVFVGTDYGITNITDSNFIDNNAHNEGGAICMNASSVYLYNSHLEGNTALSGGAIFVGEKGTSNYIYGSSFDNNKAIAEEEGEISHGGALNWLSAAGHILYSNFTNNEADYGGAIYLNGKSNNTVMDHLIFDNNHAEFNGGAIDWNAQNGQLYNTTFIYNTAQYGAALCREAEATGGSGKDNVFEYNHAYKGGAALAWMGSVGITIVNYTFNYNTANEAGAAIYIASESHNCSIIDSRFTGNEILNETGGHGGAIYTTAQNATIINTNFTENKAHYGGAIFVGSLGGSTNITDSIFTANSAVADGGAIYLIASNTIINRTQFYDNTATNGGAINAAGTGEVNQVYNSTFDGNRADNGYGGAINWVASAGYIYYTNFTNNYAKYGGGIHFNGNSDNSKISYVIFEGNTATENGGAIECNSTEMELTYTQFISNYAKYGAALCRESGATGGFGHNNTFDRNHAYVSGAALAWLGVSNIRIINYTFTNNTADSSGAAIYVDDDSDNCKVHNCLFEENYVTNAVSGRGGAIDWVGDNGEVINTTFITCVAVEGGAIYVANTSDNMKIINSSFTSCRATNGDGGALELLGDNVIVLLSNFTSCSAMGSGGAIALINSENLNLTSVMFISCTAINDGGAIAGFAADNALINDAYFKFNHAAGHTDPDGTLYGEGGAISWLDSVKLNISDSIFFANNAYRSGGSISAENCNDSVVSGIKTYNETAEFNGGSISWINSNDVTIENNLFNDSGASYNGGTIYLMNVNNILIKDVLLNSTWASWGYGGGLYIGGNVTVNNMTLRDGHDNYDDSNGIYFQYGNSTVVNSTFEETTNIIYIAEPTADRNNTVYLTNNTILAYDGHESNKNVTHLGKDMRPEYYDYSIWNDGNLYLEDNDFDYIIFNNGTIWTDTTTWILDNTTRNETWNSSFTFYANITDDANNTIISVKTLNTWNDVYPDADPYPMPYNALIDTPLIYQGNFTIFGEDLGLKKNTVKDGGINVKLPTHLVISSIDTSNEDIHVSVRLSVPVPSNYTFDKSLLNIKLNGELIPMVNITWGIVGDKWEMVYANFTLHHIPEGTYTISAVYDGDTFHEAALNETTFSQFLRPIWIAAHAKDIFFGQTLIVNVSSNALNTVNGRIRITIDGRNMSGELRLNPDGTYVYYIPNENYTSVLEPGNHVLTVYFEKGTYYAAQSNSSEFNVYKLETPLDVNYTNITFGENEIINVTLNETTQGYVALRIGSQIYVAIINQGFAQFNVSGLTAGIHNATVTFPGDNHFNETSKNITFTVNATSDYTFDVKVDDIEYKQNATVRVLVPTNAKGNVTIYVDGNDMGTLNVTNGTAVLDVSGLAGGPHVVNVTYNGDSTYAPRENNNNEFMVNPASNWRVSITEVDYKPYGETTTINITNIPDDLLGDSLIIRIDGVPYIVPINETTGKATLRLNNLSAGTHIAEVVYEGDANYGPISQTFRPSIPKATPTINLTQDGTDLIATVSGNITGNVTFTVNNEKFTVNLTNGNATLPNKLIIGNNYVGATYNGNQNYTSAETSGIFYIDKLNTTIVVNSSNITYGENELINVTVDVNATGFIAVNISGQLYVAVINEGIAKFNISGLAANTYSEVPVIYYSDNSIYNRVITNTTFTVSPTSDYAFDVKVDDIEYKQNATVRVLVPTDAKGNVTIYVDGINMGTLNVTNGTAVLDGISGLAGGPHVVNVTYSGDSTYAPGVNNNNEFMVNPNTSWKVNITEVDYRPYGETTTINITNIPDDLLGDNLTIRIDGVP